MMEENTERKGDGMKEEGMVKIKKKEIKKECKT